MENRKLRKIRESNESEVMWDVDQGGGHRLTSNLWHRHLNMRWVSKKSLFKVKAYISRKHHHNLSMEMRGLLHCSVVCINSLKKIYLVKESSPVLLLWFSCFLLEKFTFILDSSLIPDNWFTYQVVTHTLWTRPDANIAATRAPATAKVKKNMRKYF